MGHLLMENRNALIVDAELTRAGGTAEREAALTMLDRRKGRCRRITLGADKAYDVRSFVEGLRERRVTPHIAIDGHVRVTGRPRKTAIDKRTTRHPGYAASQRLRKRIEESFGWIKTTGNLAKTRHRGCDRVGWTFTLTAVAYNLVRIPKLLDAT
jgi:IS5 family transposase